MKLSARRMILLPALSFTLGAVAADWPCYQADARRSGVTSDRLAFPLAPAWTHQPAQAPRPAWPEPGRTLNLQDFDYAFQPVAAGGRVFYGSSADDSVRALDARTGRELWRFTAGAPVRFAPHIADGRCYFASDDGRVFCVTAAEGRPVWSFDAAPEVRMLPGNERMISRWPCRSGVLVADGVVYVTAGMWPSEGVYFYALDAATGKVRWCNDTASAYYLRYPHAPSVSFGGPAPQGYLLATDDLLLVPTGKALPAAFERATGALRHYAVENGATWVTIAGDYFFTPRAKLLSDADVTRLGENGANVGDGLSAYRLDDGKAGWPLSDSQYELVSRDTERKLERTVKHGLSERQRLLAQGSVFYACGEGIIEALDVSDGKTVRRIWKADFPRTYTLVLAGDALLAGGPGRITAWDAKTGKEIWTAETDGRVRGLAVADGRLLAATDKGALLSYAPASEMAGRAPVRTGAGAAGAAKATAPAPAVNEALAALQALLPAPEACRGYALVAGENDARLAEALAAATRYHVIGILPDEAAVGRERTRLLESGAPYGTRIALHAKPASGDLPYAQYFANLVVVSGDAHGLAPQELARVTRPSGGLLAGLGSGRALVEALKGQAEWPAGAVKEHGPARVVSRGKLPGAFDWDSPLERDQRVKWPLELLWFGGPGPDRMVARHWKAPTPVYANGRYFALGPYHLIAVDAYNGCELWSRQIGGHSVYRTTAFAADDAYVYVNYDGYCVAFDAATGAVRGVYGDRKPAPRVPLAEAQTFEFKNAERTCGTLRMEARPDGLALTLRTIPPPPPAEGERREPMAPEAWELHFDFRPPAAAYGGDSTGLFRMVLGAATGARQEILSLPAAPFAVTKNTVESGHELTLFLPWSDLKEFMGGAQPAGFRFAATMYTGNPDRRFGRIDLFANGMNSYLNRGWAVCVLDAAREAELALAVSPVHEGPMEELPAYARTYPRQPTQFTGTWTLDLMDRFEFASWPPVNRDGISPLRSMPLTGAASPRTYTRSYGCSGTISSLTMDFMRSGTLGMYDREDDSGMRNFSAIKPGCGMTMVPAGGILVSSEGASDCICAYNFQTSMALAPAARRSHEDWAMFNGRMRPGMIRHAALNLGAPGDRRDAEGTLWLGFPRQPVALEKGMYTFDIPCTLDYFEGFGPFRFNADRVTVGGTDRPWLFASGARGLRKVTLDLYYDVPETCLAVESRARPRIDGRLDDACWAGIASLTDKEGQSVIHLRHDREQLYVAADRQGVIDRRGAVVPFEFVLHNEQASRFLRVGATPDGAVKASLLDYGFGVPPLAGVTVDGNPGEWGDTGFTIPVGTGGVCRFAWSDRGLLVACEAPRGTHVAKENMTGLLVLVVRPGSTDYYQLAFDLKAGVATAGHRIRTDDRPPETTVVRNVNGLMHGGHPFGKVLDTVPGLAVASGASGDRVHAEALFPWAGFKMAPEQGAEVSFVVLAYDPDRLDPQFRKGNDCRPRILEGRGTMNRLRLASAAGVVPAGAGYQGRSYGYDLFRFEIPMEEQALTAQTLGGAVRMEEGRMRAELALPWAELARHGVRATDLGLLPDAPAPLSGTFDQVARAFDTAAHAVYAHSMIAPVRNYTVRLYFMEPDELPAGGRVFDIRLQGRDTGGPVDIVKEAGGARRALVKEFRGVRAERELAVELAPRSPDRSDRTVPVLSALEVLEE